MKRILPAVLCVLFLFSAGCESAPPAPTQREVFYAPTPEIVKPTPSPAPAPSPAPSPTLAPPKPVRAVILAAGDLMCLYAQLNAARKKGAYNFDYCFAEIKHAVEAADLAIANLETLVAEGYGYAGPTPTEEAEVPSPTEGVEPTTTVVRKNPQLNAPEAYLSAVAKCGFDVLINANNHMFDCGADGIAKTLQRIDEYGLSHTGAYSAKEDKKPLIVDVMGINVAILSYTDVLNANPKRSDAFMVDRYSDALAKSDLAAAKSAGADFCVVYMHWGTEHTHQPTSRQKKIASFLAGAGADIILGSHPHCTQPFESVTAGGRIVPVLYSMGNLVSSMSGTLHTDGAMATFVLEKEPGSGATRIVDLSYIPASCAGTSAGNFVALPADLQSIAQGGSKAKALEASRKRTIGVLGEDVARAE